MARTIKPFLNLRRRLAASTPATIETMTVFDVSHGTSPGATSSSFCGFTPSTTIAGAPPASFNDITVRTPSTGLPLGRMATASDRSTPADRQPSTIAPAMLPQPTNQVGDTSCISAPMLRRGCR
jgi:hypothetical protein